MLAQKQLGFKLSRTTENITAHSGLVLFDAFIKNSAIKHLIDKYMPLPGSNRGYTAWQYIQPILLMLLGGGCHVEDLRQIRDDSGLRRMIGLKTMPSLSTFGDWIRRQGSGRGLLCINKVNTETVKRFLRANTSVKELTLWSDPTIIEAEKQNAKMTYKGVRGYRPVVTAFKEIPLIIYHEFKDGNNHEGQLRAIKAAFDSLPEGKKIVHVSLDSEYYISSVINYLTNKGVSFCIVADLDRAVKETVKTIKQWRPYIDREGIVTDREIGETIHTMNKTEEAFRIVVLRWRNPQRDLFSEEYFYHAIATNLDCKAEEVVYRYNERAQMENIIKELKIGFSAEHMPFNDFAANSFWFSLQVLAYNIFVMTRELIFPEIYKTKTINTVRWKLIQIAGKVINKARQILLKVAATVEKFREYLAIKWRLEKVTALV